MAVRQLVGIRSHRAHRIPPEAEVEATSVVGTDARWRAVEVVVDWRDVERRGRYVTHNLPTT